MYLRKYLGLWNTIGRKRQNSGGAITASTTIAEVLEDKILLAADLLWPTGGNSACTYEGHNNLNIPREALARLGVIDINGDVADEHNGADDGVPVFAAQAGRVSAMQWETPNEIKERRDQNTSPLSDAYGNFIIIEHLDGATEP